jgi:phage terminase large subunit
LCVNALIDAALRCQKPEPRFAYIAPLFGQAKDIAWSYLKAYALTIPGAEAHETELRVDFPNGARVRLYGADNPDRLRGIYLDGVVLDEYADMNPLVWSSVIRPALSDRLGWAIFIGTPKGKNDFWRLYEDAASDPDWFAAIYRASETGIVDPAELVAAAKAMSPDQYEQEYQCSFDAAIVGAYYATLMNQARADKRVTRVPYEPLALVHTAWDLGLNDATAIWFFQVIGREIRIIDYLASSNQTLDWYAAELNRRPYNYGDDYLPHDARARELQSGRSREETLRALGRKPRIVPMMSVADGVNAVRTILPRCWFDEEKTSEGLEAMAQYRREWDDKKKTFNDRPLHDWTSDPADAFRMLALSVDSVSNDHWGKSLSYPKLRVA